MTREQLHRIAGEEIWDAGVALYQNRGVRKIDPSPLSPQQTNVVQFSVSSIPKHTVAVRQDGNAAVCNCDEYKTNLEKNGKRMCRHVVAAILFYLSSGEADEYLSRIAFAAGTDLLNSYESVVHDARLIAEPTLHLPLPGKTESAYLSLRIGKRRPDGETKLYAVRSMPKFLHGHMAQQEVEFSKTFTYQPQWTQFEDSQMKLLRLLCEIITALEMGDRSAQGDRAGRSSTDARFLPIPPLMLAQLLRLLSDSPFHLAIGEHECVIESVSDEPLPLTVCLDVAGRDIELTCNMRGGRPVPIDSEGMFVFLAGKVYRLDQEKRQALCPLLTRMSLGQNSYRFQSTQAERVMSELLPQLRLATDVTIGEGLRRRLVNEKLQARVYLDRQGSQASAGGIMARVKFRYGIVEIDPFAPAGVQMRGASERPDAGFTRYDPDHPDEYEKNPADAYEERCELPADMLLMRNAEGERAIIDVLSGFGFKVRMGEVHLTSQDEIYAFFMTGVRQLASVSEIFCSDAFRRMTPHKLSPHGHTTVSDGKLLLSLEGELAEIPPQELLALLSALRDRHKYFRLRDGSILTLDEVGEDWLELADAVADNGVVRRSGVVELESYRAAYLNSMLKSLSGMTTDESVDEAARMHVETDPLPEDLENVLRAYQKKGFEWLQALYRLDLGGVLADDMGLGKTLQVISLLVWAKRRDGVMPSLVVSPTTLTYNWLSELKKFAPELTCTVLDGSRAHRENMVAALKTSPDTDVVITSYPLIRRDSDLLADIPFRFCVLDEAQNIKNAQSVGANAVSVINAKSRFALTGTPMENHPGELWSIFNFVMPGYLPGQNTFMNTHGMGQNLDILRAKLRPFLLRRLKKDVLTELPEKLEQTIVAEPTSEQLKVYKASMLRLRGHVQELLGRNSDSPSVFGRSRVEVLSAITELRQICCHPSLCLGSEYTGSSGKLELLMELVPDAIEAGHRILLFSSFTSMLAIIREKLNEAGIPTLYLDGQTPAEERIALVDSFNSGLDKEAHPDVPDVFLISLKAGGSGLNLVGADTVIHYDPWWNPAVEDQATDRVYRIGQTRSVQVLRLITKDTVEQGVLEMASRKRALFEQVITAGETIPTQLSEQEILSLFEM